LSGDVAGRRDFIAFAVLAATPAKWAAHFARIDRVAFIVPAGKWRDFSASKMIEC
jgi:hypothetical protein